MSRLPVGKAFDELTKRSHVRAPRSNNESVLRESISNEKITVEKRVMY
jgi:hypothetical protein